MANIRTSGDIGCVIPKGGEWFLNDWKALGLIFRDLSPLSPLLEGEGIGGEVHAERTKRQYGLVWHRSRTGGLSAVLDSLVGHSRG